MDQEVLMTQYPQDSLVMSGARNAQERVKSSENSAPGDGGGVGLWGGIWKVRWCLCPSASLPQSGTQSEKAHLQAVLLTQSLGTLRPGARIQSSMFLVA